MSSYRLAYCTLSFSEIAVLTAQNNILIPLEAGYSSALLFFRSLCCFLRPLIKLFFFVASNTSLVFLPLLSICYPTIIILSFLSQSVILQLLYYYFSLYLLSYYYYIIISLSICYPIIIILLFLPQFIISLLLYYYFAQSVILLL